MTGQHLNQPIVGLSVDRQTGGYWLVAADGGVFAFNAPFLGSTGGIHLNKPVVGVSTTINGTGYWLVAADGGVFAYNVPFYGSTGSLTLNKPVVGMGLDRTTGGYWLVAADGGVFAYQRALRWLDRQPDPQQAGRGHRPGVRWQRVPVGRR